MQSDLEYRYNDFLKKKFITMLMIISMAFFTKCNNYLVYLLPTHDDML